MFFSIPVKKFVWKYKWLFILFGIIISTIIAVPIYITEKQKQETEMSLANAYKFKTRCHSAVIQGRLDLLNLTLHQEGPNCINSKNKHDETPLHLASNTGKIDIMEYLLKHGADVWIKNDKGQIPLNLAAKNGFKIFTFSLFAKMVNLDVNSLPNHFGLDDDESLMKILSSISKDDKNLLFKSAKEGNKATIKILHAIGVDLNAKDLLGRSTLDLASINGKYDVVGFLLDNEVDCGCVTEHTKGNFNYCNHKSGFCECEDNYCGRSCFCKNCIEGICCKYTSITQSSV